jgi:hypothetical protein
MPYIDQQRCEGLISYWKRLGREAEDVLRDVMLRVANVVFALLVHTLSDPAKPFYLSRSFVESPLQPMTPIMTLETVRSILAEPDCGN